MRAIQIEAFGNAAEILKAVDVPDVGAPAANEVVIAAEASPVNQYASLLVGCHGYRPAIMGTGGAAHVVAVSSAESQAGHQS